MTCPTSTRRTNPYQRTRRRYVQIPCVREPTVVMQVAGELDAALSGALRSSLIAACEGGATLEINLSQVTFIDSAGAGFLLSADLLLRRNGGRLILVDPIARVHAALGRLARCPAVRTGGGRVQPLGA